MAIVTSGTEKGAEVQALGAEKKATVNFSAALMEMLSTVYKYILLAAIREGVQNACDAARRAGMSFETGVEVLLPTPDNPMITILDRGEGMTGEFMDTTYLSFGSSTKAGDNESAGGLGVGRWAAYGYIRECYIVTCNKEEMVERTYFQFRGADGSPSVQLAAEVPGTLASVGTKVFFPVKGSDVKEAIRIVTYLREVMQLTMGDSFSVDEPGALYSDYFPARAGTVFELGRVDTALDGIKVYPMAESTLQYSRAILQDGSVVVLTNQSAGIGGLPFNVSTANDSSVFRRGMVIEIPMRFGIPFMPSREEIKYTDEVLHLMDRIDAAAATMLCQEVKRLHGLKSIRAKQGLTDLLGTTGSWHWFSLAGRGVAELGKAVNTILGGNWDGYLPVNNLRMTAGLSLRFARHQKEASRSSSGQFRMATAFLDAHRALCISTAGRPFKVIFNVKNPIILVVNDLKTGGMTRFKSWLASADKEYSYLFISSDKLSEAREYAEELNGNFGNELVLLLTSAMPEVVRKSELKLKSAAPGSTLVWYNRLRGMQESQVMGFDTYSATETKRVWLGRTKDGNFTGFRNATVKTIFGGSTSRKFATLKFQNIYLLSEKQVANLRQMQEEAQDRGLFDLERDEFEQESEFLAIQALRSWTPFESEVADMVQSTLVQDVLAGTRPWSVCYHYSFSQVCQMLAEKPRMELTGTSLDKALSPYVDLLTGRCNLLTDSDVAEAHQVIEDLNQVATQLLGTDSDSDGRKEMLATLAKLATVSVLDYHKVWSDLMSKFPLLKIAQYARDEPQMSHYMASLAYLYR